MRLFLKSTYINRQEVIKKYEKESKPMMSTIPEQWPCFESGEYVSIHGYVHVL